MKITIARIRKPNMKNINEDLQWFSDSLGLFTERDKEKSCFRIFVQLVRAARKRQILSSDELALKSNLSRGTVIHHLKKLIDSSLIMQYKNGYMLKADNLETLTREIKREVDSTFEELSSIAKELDDELGLLKRKEKENVIE